VGWTITAEAGKNEETGISAHAIDVDPRRRRVSMGRVRRSGGDAALWGNTVARHFVDCSVCDWAEAAAWVRGPEGLAVLERISAGYAASMAWSGDWVAEWSPGARGALRDLLEAVEARLGAE